MKRILLISIFGIISLTLSAQAPQGFNYQAVARDAEGNLLSETALAVRIGLYRNDELVWQEEHSVETNQLGLFTLTVGGAFATQTGGSAGSFGEIQWGTGEFELEVSLDTGSGFLVMGRSALMSVPYALFAQNAPADGDGNSENELQTISIDGSLLTLSDGGGTVTIPGDGDADPSNEIQDLSYENGMLGLTQDPTATGINLSNVVAAEQAWDLNSDTIFTYESVGIGTNQPNQSLLAIQSGDPQVEKPLFEVRNDLGNPVFAVYNDGVMVYVDDAKKGVKGGFAVGGYNSASKGVTQEYLRITPDSVRIYVPDTPAAKGIKGGFAVGGYNTTSKASSFNFLEVNSSETNIQFDTARKSKAIKGGFAVGGYNSSAKAEATRLMSLTPQNYLIGENAGANITTGKNNSFIGYEAGFNNASGQFNTYIGFNAGFSGENASGSNNVMIGDNSGASNISGNNNVFLGNSSGLSNTGGNDNVFLGNEAGNSNTTGESNIFIGTGAGSNNQTGAGNIMMGRVAGYSGTAHNNNIFFGDSSGYFTNNQFATKNVFIGYAAGKNTQSYNNVFIGNRAGYQNSGGQNNIAIGDLAGYNNTSSQNIFIGTEAGKNNTEGFFNIMMGRYAGRNNTTGVHQILIGGGAGSSLTTGEYNVIIGGQAGVINSTGSRNVYLGYTAGWSNTGSGNIFIGPGAGYGVHENVSDRLIISNSSDASPLIFGDFANDNLELNANVGIGTTSSSSHGLRVDGGSDANYSLVVFKGAYAYGNGFLDASDASLKTNIRDIEDALGIIQALHGVTFNWKDSEGSPNQKQQVGLIAQEVEKVLPQVVSENAEQLKGVAYSKITAVLIEAVKEQQKQIESMQAEIEALKAGR